MSLSFRFFAVLLFLSAFLLFVVQPLASRIILPTLGGSPSVWTTSMLFFQALLLGGYLWAHIMVRFMPAWMPPLIQVIIAVTAAFFVRYASPLDFDYATENATWWQLKTLGIMVGLPYFALATNAPLYQAVYKEFQNTKTGKTPYALYSLSNVGSFLALLSYPFLIEPLLPLGLQASLWHAGYIVLCGIIALSGILCLVFHSKNKLKKDTNASLKPHNLPSKRTIGMWCLLAFIPSSLMLGVTAHVTTDVASIPLLWIIPLAFYLASFVMAFAEPPLWIAKNEKLLSFYTFGLLAFTLCFTVATTHQFIWMQVVLHYVTFLFAATLCHLKLAQLKPHADQLTFFYLIVSVGGCLGGIFNALIAHHIFVIPVEYILSIVLLVSVFARHPAPYDKQMNTQNDPAVIIVAVILFASFAFAVSDTIKLISVFSMALVMVIYWDKKRAFLIFAACLCLLYTYGKFRTGDEKIHLSRNVFGTLIVQNNAASETRTIIHGTTLHGVQPLPITDHPSPSSYYNKKGPLGDVFRLLDQRGGSQNVAALGLGVGTVACYQKPGRDFKFFEINQDVIDIAKNPDYFTYLSSCAPDAEIALGDARINLTKDENGVYDLILVDTFSSDSIPVHLMTKQALEIYSEKATNNGLIVFHVSNRYFDLRPVITAMAKDAGLHAAYKSDNAKDSKNSFVHAASIYVVVAKNSETLNRLVASSNKWKQYDETKRLPEVWTDDYVNVFNALRL